jgi:hypothetical protein
MKKQEILNGVDNVRHSWFVKPNTLFIELENGDKITRLYETNIVINKKDGTTILNSGGWRTQTTRERLNNLTPFHIYQEKLVWYISTPKSQTFQFYDGITFNRDYTLKGRVVDTRKGIEKRKSIIKGYVKLLDNINQIPNPSPGDCWYCLLQTEKSQSLGDSFKDTDHLWSHLKEGYLFGSIIWNSLKENGYNPSFVILLNVKDVIKRSLRNYLYKRLLY